MLASPDNSNAPPSAPAEFQRTCEPPEELLLVDTCFDKGDGEAIGCEKVEVPVRLEAGDFGERCVGSRNEIVARVWRGSK